MDSLETSEKIRLPEIENFIKRILNPISVDCDIYSSVVEKIPKVITIKYRDKFYSDHILCIYLELIVILYNYYYETNTSEKDILNILLNSNVIYDSRAISNLLKLIIKKY